MAEPEKNNLLNLPHLPHNAQELSGHAPSDAASHELASKTADVMIRMVMIEQKRVQSRQILPDLEKDPVGEPDQGGPQSGRFFKVRAQRPNESRTKAGHITAASSKRLLDWLRWRNFSPPVFRHRPTRRYTFAATMTVIFLWRPWLLPILFLVAVWIVLIVYLTLGPDRVTELVVGRWQKLRRDRPELAERLRRRANRMTLRLHAVLNRLPDKWTEGLYLPDFSDPAPDAKSVNSVDDPFEKLAKEAQRS